MSMLRNQLGGVAPRKGGKKKEGKLEHLKPIIKENEMSEQEVVSKQAGTATKNDVTMTDGRVVSFSPKRQVLKEALPGEDGVRFDFANGETRTIMIEDIPSDILRKLTTHGLSQKVGDEYAGFKDIDEAISAVDDMKARLERGDWTSPRATGDGFSGASIVVKAVCQVTGKTPQQVKDFLANKLSAAKERGEKLTRNDLYRSFRNPNSRTGKLIAQMEAEKNQGKTSPEAEDLLSEIE